MELDAIRFPRIDFKELPPYIEEAKLGDAQCQHVVVLSTMPLVLKIIRPWRAERPHDYEDMFQECVFAVYRSIRLYDRTKGAWSTYVTLWVRKTIQQYWAEITKHKHTDIESTDEKTWQRRLVPPAPSWECMYCGVSTEARSECEACYRRAYRNGRCPNCRAPRRRTRGGYSCDVCS